MKAIKVIAVLALGGMIGLGAGCGQKEEQTPPTVTDAQSAAQKAASDTQKAVTETPKAAEAQAPAVQAAASDATAAASSEAQSLIDKAKAAIANKDYQGATALIKDLSQLKLTPEQQKLVDDLKAQLQKAMTSGAATDATKAVGGMLGGK